LAHRILSRYQAEGPGQLRGPVGDRARRAPELNKLGTVRMRAEHYERIERIGSRLDVSPGDQMMLFDRGARRPSRTRWHVLCWALHPARGEDTSGRSRPTRPPTSWVDRRRGGGCARP